MGSIRFCRLEGERERGGVGGRERMSERGRAEQEREAQQMTIIVDMEL